MSQKLKVAHVTVKELADILGSVETVHGNPIFASVLQATKPKCTVKSRKDASIKNPYNEIIKYSYASILLNSDYEKAVTNQLAKEGKDADEYQKGKSPITLEFGDNNRFIGTNVANGDFMLVYRPNDAVKPTTYYVADGERKDKSDLADFLPLDNHATNQGTEREISWRNVYLKNIKELTFNKVLYKVLN